MLQRIKVAVVGCTGLVGQQFLHLLQDHPWFEVRELVGSTRTIGRTYAQAVEWMLGSAVPPQYADRRIRSANDNLDARIVFSALPSHAAAQLEPQLAQRGYLVFSNASALRLASGVPLVIPEVNGHRLRQVIDQPYANVGGGIVTNPNCVVAGLTLALAPLHQQFGLEFATLVTLQAISGAGAKAMRESAGSRTIVPCIAGEDEKIHAETNHILGTRLSLSISTNRVSVLLGHTVSVFLKTRDRATPRAIADALIAFRSVEQLPRLPTAPERLVLVRDTLDRPQPTMDVDQGDGMSVSVGGIRADPVYDVKFTLLVNNLIRGAAGAGVLNAEWAMASGYLDELPTTSRLSADSA